MKFLLIGDIYGKLGREYLSNHLQKIVLENNIDVIIANGENISHGSSITEKHYNFLKNLGIDVITTGNHIFHKNEVINYIDNKKDLLRPINMNSFLPGNGFYLFKKNNKKIMVTNIMGKSFMDHVNNPYESFDKVLNKNLFDIHIVDFHAEATAEKRAFALNYDGKITCLFGTHTHVQTADNRILPNGTAFISDVGMTGPYDSVVGADPKAIIEREKTGLRIPFKPVTTGIQQFCGAVLEVDDKTNKAIKLERIFATSKKEEK